MTSQEKFEKWYLSEMVDYEFNILNTNDIRDIFTKHTANGYYKEFSIQSSFRGWQAREAALAQPTQPKEKQNG